MLVWLTDWQLAEDLVMIRAVDVVDWKLHEADRSWMSRLFADRLAIEWQLDSYGDAVEQPSRRVRGEVVELRSVRCRQVTTEEGRVPVTGQAQLLPVEDTSGSWKREALPAPSEESRGISQSFYTFGYASVLDDDEIDALYGYVVTLKLSDDGLGLGPGVDD
jgi:hypothetical protein